MKIITVGGVALGASFVTRMKRLDRNIEIKMFEKSSYISYANCGLPYNLSGKIDRERLELVTPEEMKEKFDVDVFVKHEVISINTKGKYVMVKDLKTQKTFKESYDKLVLGPGTRAFEIPIKGIEKEENKFPLKNLDDLDKIQKFRKRTRAKKFLVLGAGFIGLEAAESLAEDGQEVNVAEISNTVAKFDKDISVFLEKELVQKNVNLFLNAGVKKVDAKRRVAILTTGKEIKYDMILMSAGVRPNTEFIKKSGIKVDDRGVVITNEFMQTSDKDVYAGGDIVYSKHHVTGNKQYSPLAWGANRQAKVIANHIFGIEDKQPDTMQTAIIKVFRLTAAMTGMSEFEAQRAKIDYDIVYYSGNHHASYYPGAKNVVLKVIYEKETLRVLGAQSVGASADKKIDVIATALYHNATMEDLLNYNLAYSPPYGSAKDVVNLAASIAVNRRDQKLQSIKAEELKKEMFIIDVNPPTVHEVSSIPGSINIPLETLADSKDLPEDKDSKIYLHCNTGHTSYNGLKILESKGYSNLVNVIGGNNRYQAFKWSREYKPTTGRKKVASAPKAVKETTKAPVASASAAPGKAIALDCTGLSCPGPLLKLHKKLNEVQNGTIIDVTASDFGFEDDVKTWVEKNGHTLISASSDDEKVYAKIQKGQSSVINEDSQAIAGALMKDKERATIVLFSGEYDKVIGALIIAQAAASLGKKVTVFATFWGLNALRIKPRKKPKKKFMEKMFGKMMPRGVEEFPLTQMNYGGLGKKIIKSVMKKHNVKTPDKMIKDAQELGVEFIACTMSMDLLGIRKEELLEGVSFAGVAKYISHADDSNVTLFI